MIMIMMMAASVLVTGFLVTKYPVTRLDGFLLFCFMRWKETLLKGGLLSCSQFNKED